MTINILNPFETYQPTIKGKAGEDEALEPCTLSVPDIDDIVALQHEFYCENQPRVVQACNTRYNNIKYAIIAEQRQMRNATRLRVGMALKPFMKDKPN